MNAYDKLLQMTDMECSKWPEGRWHDCCMEHDYDYIDGENKWKADGKLWLCVTKRGHPITASLMWLGVTIGGWRPYNKYKRIRKECQK